MQRPCVRHRPETSGERPLGYSASREVSHHLRANDAPFATGALHTVHQDRWQRAVPEEGSRGVHSRKDSAGDCTPIAGAWSTAHPHVSTSPACPSETGAYLKGPWHTEGHGWWERTHKLGVIS